LAIRFFGKLCPLFDCAWANLNALIIASCYSARHSKPCRNQFHSRIHHASSPDYTASLRDRRRINREFNFQFSS
jgi:hypothetical protein